MKNIRLKDFDITKPATMLKGVGLHPIGPHNLPIEASAGVMELEWVAAYAFTQTTNPFFFGLTDAGGGMWIDLIPDYENNLALEFVYPSKEDALSDFLIAQSQGVKPSVGTVEAEALGSIVAHFIYRMLDADNVEDILADGVQVLGFQEKYRTPQKLGEYTLSIPSFEAPVKVFRPAAHEQLIRVFDAFRTNQQKWREKVEKTAKEET